MKNRIGFFTNLALLSVTATSAYAADPFIQTWSYFDGVSTYNLTIAKSKASNQNYSINYSFPGGNASTDMCALKSSNSLHCTSGETLVLDEQNYSINLTSSISNFTFYANGHQPHVSNMVGNWNYQTSNTYWDGETVNLTYTISIRKGTNDSEYNVTTSMHSNTNAQCSGWPSIVYKVTTNPDNTLLFSNTDYSFKYDSEKNVIVNPNPRTDFKAGYCAQFSSSYNPDFGKEIFVKN